MKPLYHLRKLAWVHIHDDEVPFSFYDLNSHVFDDAGRLLNQQSATANGLTKVLLQSRPK